MDGGQIWVGWRSSILGHSGRILGEYAAAGSVAIGPPRCGVKPGSRDIPQRYRLQAY